MSLIKKYSESDFQLEFPNDLGSGMRFSVVETTSGFKGIMLSHLVDSILCSTLISLKSPAGPMPVGVLNESPLSLDKALTCCNCPENAVGRVTEGKWIIQ